MVIRFATFDPRQDPNDFNSAFPPTLSSSSSSATLCRPCECSCTFTKTIVSRIVAAGASLVLRAPAFEIDGHEIQDRSMEMPLHGINSNVRPQFHLQEFTLQELKVATDNFSHNNIIGKGGFGRVYKGRLADGSLVAIKRCKEEKTQGPLLQFERELDIGRGITPHHNVLPMLGFCRASKSRELLLVSPFMINQCLASCLRERNDNQPPLDWPTRRKIAVGVARGLSHLHDLDILHRDIKAANIMLDEEFEPRIGDFGLALLNFRGNSGYFEDCIEEAPVLPREKSEARSDSKHHVTTQVGGTMGHIAPEYLSTGKCSVKNDVFGFGVTLLEIVTGQRTIDFTRLENDKDVALLDRVKGLLVERERGWEILVDPDLQGAYDEEEIEKLIQLALLCTQSNPRGRPSMAHVVQIFEGHSIEERWEEFQLEERWEEFQLELRSPKLYIPHTEWIIAGSTSHLRPDELSGPR